MPRRPATDRVVQFQTIACQIAKNKTPHLQLAQAGRVIRSDIRDCGHTLGSASSIHGSCTVASRRLPIVEAAGHDFDVDGEARRRAHVAHDGAEWRAPKPDVPARAGLSWAAESRRRECHHEVEVIAVIVSGGLKRQIAPPMVCPEQPTLRGWSVARTLMGGTIDCEHRDATPRGHIVKSSGEAVNPSAQICFRRPSYRLLPCPSTD